MAHMISYEVKESARAKSVRVTVHPDGRVVVTKPLRMSAVAAERFVHARSAWIEKALAAMRARALREARHPKVELPRLRRGTKAYAEAVKAARVLLTERTHHYANRYGFRYGTIRIRNQKSRWGSCTKAGNLSFNFRLLYLPPELRDYVVMHELCHTVEHNHSTRFWDLVRQAWIHAVTGGPIRTRKLFHQKEALTNKYVPCRIIELSSSSRTVAGSHFQEPESN